MLLSAKVSTKNQIAIPSEARRRLGIEPGDRLDVVVSGDTIVMRKRPARASDRLRGLGEGKGWYEPDADTYLRRLRDELEAGPDAGADVDDSPTSGNPPADRG